MKFKKFLENLGNSLIPQNIPLTPSGDVGNALKTDCGDSTKVQVSKFFEYPRPKSSKGLGNRGMEYIGKATFRKPDDGRTTKETDQTAAGS